MNDIAKLDTHPVLKCSVPQNAEDCIFAIRKLHEDSFLRSLIIGFFVAQIERNRWWLGKAESLRSFFARENDILAIGYNQAMKCKRIYEYFIEHLMIPVEELLVIGNLDTLDACFDVYDPRRSLIKSREDWDYYKWYLKTKASVVRKIAKKDTDLEQLSKERVNGFIARWANSNDHEREIELAECRLVQLRDREACCRDCGSRINIELHHIAYRSQGGKDTPENLCYLCPGCHRRIHDRGGKAS